MSALQNEINRLSTLKESFARLVSYLGITEEAGFTPLTTEEITNEINTLWEGL